MGLLIGGSASASILWAFGGALPDLSRSLGAAVLVVVAALAVLRDAGIVSFSLPENKRLVPREVLNKGPVLGGFQFGFEMGTGVRTYLSSSAPYVLAVSLVLLGPDPAQALVAGAGFGAGRAAMLLLSVASGDASRWEVGLEHWLRPITVTTCGIFLGLALLVAVT